MISPFENAKLNREYNKHVARPIMKRHAKIMTKKVVKCNSLTKPTKTAKAWKKGLTG